MKTPLCIDLDGTLIASDVTRLSVALFLQAYPWRVILLFYWLLWGRAFFKAHLAQCIMPNVAELPYNYRLIRYIQAQKKEGVLIVLATACNEKIAHKIAEHLGLFDEIIASDWSHNRRAHHKAAILIKKFGDSGFVYAGNSKDDLWVWAKAKKAIAVNASRHVLKQLYRMDKEVIVFDGSVGAPCAANEL